MSQLKKIKIISEKEVAVEDVWNTLSDDWNNHVNKDGDWTRQNITDRVVWGYLGEITNKDVLDAGAKSVYAVDSSSKMIEFAKENVSKWVDNEKFKRVHFLNESCAFLKSIADDSIDLIVCNFVLMDLSDYEFCLQNFSRVLRKGGKVSIVLLHPCFETTIDRNKEDVNTISYRWNYPYLSSVMLEFPPWEPMRVNMVGFHRPLSAYFKAFKNAGFSIEEFDEPTVTEDSIEKDEERIKRVKMNSFVASFLLQKK